MRPAALALLAILAATPALAEDLCGAGEAMGTVVAAMKSGDWDRVAALFSKEAPLKLTSTIESPPMTDTINPDVAAADIVAKHGIYELLFEADDLDTFSDVFAETGYAEWIPDDGHAERFLPPGPGYADGRTFIQFGCEGGHPVILEVGWPAA